MIALDSSSLIAFLCGDAGTDVDAVVNVLRFRQGVLPPVVVVELLSDPAAHAETAALIKAIPRLDTIDDYWIRAGELRARLLRRGFKARLADTLIAQSCLDHDVPLVTRDRDFRIFARHAGLRLA